MNMTSKFGTVDAYISLRVSFADTAEIAEAILLTNGGLDENTSRKKAAAVVNENQAIINFA